MRYAILLLVLVSNSVANGADWLTERSFYTHDPVTGQRTHQFAEPPPAIVPQTSSFQTSGFSHYRSTLQYGQSADNYHRVEQWGPPVRPYGEWRFPYRPYSAPYDQWGAPFAGLNLGFAGPGFAGPGFGGPGFGRPGVNGDPDGSRQWNGYPRDDRNRQYPTIPPFPSEPYPSGPGFKYPAPPYADGYYPDYSARPRLDDRDFYRKPTQGHYYRDSR